MASQIIQDIWHNHLEEKYNRLIGEFPPQSVLDDMQFAIQNDMTPGDLAEWQNEHYPLEADTVEGARLRAEQDAEMDAKFAEEPDGLYVGDEYETCV